MYKALAKFCEHREMHMGENFKEIIAGKPVSERIGHCAGELLDVERTKHFVAYFWKNALFMCHTGLTAAFNFRLAPGPFAGNVSGS